MVNPSEEDRKRTDSRHWSQRWMRIAIVETDALILYDLHKGMHMAGCGLCSDISCDSSGHGRRYRVQRFWNIQTCPRCGRLSGYGRNDETLYLGDSEVDALIIYDAEAGRFPFLSEI